jgi:hypothetical protein
MRRLERIIFNRTNQTTSGNHVCTLWLSAEKKTQLTIIHRSWVNIVQGYSPKREVLSTYHNKTRMTRKNNENNSKTICISAPIIFVNKAVFTHFRQFYHFKFTLLCAPRKCKWWYRIADNLPAHNNNCFIWKT